MMRGIIFMQKKVNASHGIVCRLPEDPLGYFGWPSIAKMDDGTLVAASSGLRRYHVCPWGKTVLHFSKDNGKTWSDSVIVNNSPIDDRDAGVISLGGKKLLVSWFTSDTRIYLESEWLKKTMSKEDHEEFVKEVSSWNDEMVYSHLGSWIRISEDGDAWGDPIRVPVTAPHGPIKLANGHILYFGKGVVTGDKFHSELRNGAIKSVISKDGGLSWEIIGEVPISGDTEAANYHEPHVVELSSGKLIGMIRYQHSENIKKYDSFTMFQTESNDGGKTWSMAKPTGVSGSPPHLLRHSSGAIICVYGYRKEPYGERAMISYDEGKTWNTDYILRDDAPDGDLGYPSSVELDDGSIFTLYYQKYSAGEKTSLLWTRWRLPER